MFTPAEYKRRVAEEIIDKYLSKKRLVLELVSLRIEEDVYTEQTTICIKYKEKRARSEKLLTLESKSTGVAIAIFDALVTEYSKEHPSISNLTFEEVRFKSKFEAEARESKVEFYIEFKNGRGEFAPFRDSGRSISTAAAKVVLGCFEFYINCELAFRRLRTLIGRAQKRGRADIEMELVSDISKIVGFNDFPI